MNRTVSRTHYRYITRQFIWDWITEINEDVYVVNDASVNLTVGMVLDVIDGHTTWQGTDDYVQEHQIRTLVQDWIVQHNAAHENPVYDDYDGEITLPN
jgi:hypothetical protein